MEIYSENLLNEKYRVDVALFRRLAEEILTEIHGAEGEAGLAFVSDDRIRELNRSYRNVDQPTDVLSFCFADEEYSGGVLGDVYISLETAERQAAEREETLARETLRLMIHGLLHLAGHTHDTEPDGGRMRALEERLFERYRDRVAGSCRPAAAPGSGEAEGEHST
ncbi:MAG: rRNA maturation RNase YbeY [Candidatus Eisenbacteria bacterium]|nr:rRNA maturation RNase YbeY [Candidatus Eisenbacteria bacterium]